ncbi:tRNA-splicing endonuclease subunit Sen15 [Phyllosticta citrichinensis]|uniref:tRNA-splicing endonuclease subunit Sen15 n=1 Tax=Phyllosticta citrichinensis TaxID=1130410 RepID=A0ABR1XEW2_9PEZI
MQPSLLDQKITEALQGSASGHSSHHLSLAHQTLHNLEHQHHWGSLTLHTHSPSSPHLPLSRPLLSGLPPKRLYTHPDEQIALLKEAARRRSDGLPVEGDPAPQREWVVPTHLREKWTVRQLAEAFGDMTVVPPEPESEQKTGAKGQQSKEGEEDKWRTTKRALLAIVEDDSTVVYYLVHDGIVKPRQN